MTCGYFNQRGQSLTSGFSPYSALIIDDAECTMEHTADTYPGRCLIAKKQHDHANSSVDGPRVSLGFSNPWLMVATQFCIRYHYQTIFVDLGISTSFFFFGSYGSLRHHKRLCYGLVRLPEYMPSSNWLHLHVGNGTISSVSKHPTTICLSS